MKKGKILLIDDKFDYHWESIEFLKKSYDVDVVSYLDTALFNLAHYKRYQLIILEMMMPTQGAYTKQETNDGFRTGLVFYEKELSKWGIPVLFWSSNEYSVDEIIAKNNLKLSFLQKAAEEDHLLVAVDKFLNSLELINEKSDKVLTLLSNLEACVRAYSENYADSTPSEKTAKENCVLIAKELEKKNIKHSLWDGDFYYAVFINPRDLKLIPEIAESSKINFWINWLEKWQIKKV